MTDIRNQEHADQILAALSEQLAVADERFELVVIGGSGLMALGKIERSTRDVDVVALRTDVGLVGAEPLPAALLRARDLVTRDFDLDRDWLNAEPAGLLDHGLPDGFIDRARRRDYGASLTVWLASREDQIHFKLYATVDAGGPGKHEQDLRALEPTREELIAAARWSRGHDPSEGYRDVLVRALSYLGVDDADL